MLLMVEGVYVDVDVLTVCGLWLLCLHLGSVAHFVFTFGGAATC
jgi:hypothetical protein